VHGLFILSLLHTSGRKNLLSDIYGDVHIFSIVTTEPKAQTGPHLEQSIEDLVTLLIKQALEISHSW
jgi:hypothetical protein